RPREDRVPRSRPPRPGPSWTESSGTGYRGRPLRVRRPNASAWRRHRHARPMRPRSARYVCGVGSGFVTSLFRSAPARPQDLSHSSSVRTRPPAAAFVTFCPRRPGSVVITQPRAACHKNTLSQYFSGAQLLGSMISASSPDVAGAIRVFGHTFQVTSQPWVEGVLFCPKRKDLSPIPGTSSDLGAPPPRVDLDTRVTANIEPDSVSREEVTRMHTPAVEKLTGGVWSLPIPIPDNPLGFTYVYLVEGSEGPLLIDTGWNHDQSWQALLRGVERTGHT